MPATVYKLHANANKRPSSSKGKGREQKKTGNDIVDKVFFVKADVKIGTKITCWGRLSPGHVYRVTEIRSFRRSQRGPGYVTEQVQSVRYMSDTIRMYCPETGEHREATFSYLSYSGIWWLS